MQQDASTPTQRQRRIGEQLRYTISETLQKGRFHDEILLDAAKNITVSEVRVSGDLKQANVFVLRLGGGEMQSILDALNDAAPYFQSQINRKMRLKFTPRVHFIHDESFDEAEKISRIISEELPSYADDQTQRDN
jgi:ribosome-binding factor A